MRFRRGLRKETKVAIAVWVLVQMVVFLLGLMTIQVNKNANYISHYHWGGPLLGDAAVSFGCGLIAIVVMYIVNNIG